jgi:hypothetical protein
MSAVSSLASAASISGSSELGCTSCGNASQTISAAAYLRSIGRTFPASKTCESCHAPQGRRRSMSSAAGSPAKTSASPAEAQASVGRARVFGQSTPVSLASLSPDGSSWRTSQLSLDGDSQLFSQTWPRSGMTRSGTAFQLQPLAPLTGGTASGLLPTPSASSYGSNQGGAGRVGPVRHSLQSMARHGLWPTPTRQDAANDGGPSQFERNSLPLNAAVKTWPTPKATDADKGGRGDLLAQVRTGKDSRRKNWPTPTSSNRDSAGGSSSRAKQKRDGTYISGQLNPTWVEWLMGFSLGWTVCEPLVTHSSRRSQSGSGNGS